MSAGTSTRDKGRWGEDIAAKHLKRKGYKVIERNWSHKSGEIDIIAREGDDLVFIEVKLRSSTQFGTPAEAVNNKKARRIINAAGYYVASKYGVEVPMRFDIVEVYASESCKPGGLKGLFSKKDDIKVQVIKNALVA